MDYLWSAVDVNVLKTYTNPLNKNEIPFNTGCDGIQIPSLRIMCLNKIAEHWKDQPIYNELQRPEDRQYLTEVLDVTIPLETLIDFIRENNFWKRCYLHYWPSEHRQSQNWIFTFMEKYLSESLENMNYSDYEINKIENLMNICDQFVKILRITQLQPSMQEESDHIPLDYILSRLFSLEELCLTFDIKTIGRNFIFGCTKISVNDIRCLTEGLETCNNLRIFQLRNTRLDESQIRIISKAICFNCPMIEKLEFISCFFGDDGLVALMEHFECETLTKLKHLNLSDNGISGNAIEKFTKSLSNRKLQSIDLSLNPIDDLGAILLFSCCSQLELESLNLSGCSINDSIIDGFTELLQTNESLVELKLSANKFNDSFGKIVIQALHDNQMIESLDLRNCNISVTHLVEMQKILLNNRLAKRRIPDFSGCRRYQQYDFYAICEDKNSLNL